MIIKQMYLPPLCKVCRELFHHQHRITWFAQSVLSHEYAIITVNSQKEEELKLTKTVAHLEIGSGGKGFKEKKGCLREGGFKEKSDFTRGMSFKSEALWTKGEGLTPTLAFIENMDDKNNIGVFH